MPALRSIVAAIVAVCFGVFAAGALAAPSAVPQPTPPPGAGGGGGSGGGGGGGGGGAGSAPIVRRPTGPVAVGNGAAGAVLLEATGERTRAPVDTTGTTTTGTPPVTTAGAPVAPVTTAAAPVTTAQAPATTAEIAPPVTTAAQPAASGSSGGDAGTPALPRDGIVVLIGVLLLGTVVALRAIRARERRIGLALLGFCVIYLLGLAGLVTGIAGAAIANPGSFAVTAGDGETLLTFDPPPAGSTLAVRRLAGSVPPAACSTGTPVTIAAPTSGRQVDGPLANGARVSYRACLVDGTGASAGATASATPVSGLDSTAPRPVAGLVVRRIGGRVALAWHNPADRDYAATVVVRKLGSVPASPRDGKVVYSGDRPSLLDYPFSLIPIHYAAFAVDEDGNSATPTRASLPNFDPPLRTPLDRSSTTARQPRFTWRPVAKTDQYNVKIYRADRCCTPRDVIVNTFPKGASVIGPRPLDPGVYVWYVFAHVTPVGARPSYKALSTIGWRFRVK